MFRIPPQGHEANDHFNSMEEISADNAETFTLSRIGAAAALRECKVATAITYLVLSAKDELQLIKFNRNGSWRVIWTF